jgi:hypothetical protein
MDRIGYSTNVLGAMKKRTRDRCPTLRPPVPILFGEQTHWLALLIQFFLRREQAESLSKEQHKSATAESA